MLPEYETLYETSPLKHHPYFLYNYGAELNFSGRSTQSITILKKCQKQFNDYDLQLLQADNYYQIGETELALQFYRDASAMIPCRFFPLYRIFQIYQESGQMENALKCATNIVSKQVKVPSLTVNSMKAEARKFCNNH